MAIEILDKGACKAMGVLDTSASVVSAATAGIRRVISTGVNGRVRLVLEEGIGQTELVAHVTPLPPAIGAGVIPAVAWIDAFTIEIQTYDITGLLAAAQVRFSFFKIQALASPTVDPALPNPQQILGNNLALWLQADIGLDEVAPGAPVTTWPNQVANGNAVQGANADPAVLRPNSFGSRPGVACESVDSGLVVTLTTPAAIGQRPYFWARARSTQILDPDVQTMFIAFDNPLLANELAFDGARPGEFGPVAVWDWETFTPGGVQTDQPVIPGPDLDLAPRTFQCATQQAGALVIDGLVSDAPGPIAALSVAINSVYLSGIRIPPFIPANSPGLWNYGVFVMSFDQPSPAEIAAVQAWCDAYA